MKKWLLTLPLTLPIILSACSRGGGSNTPPPNGTAPTDTPTPTSTPTTPTVTPTPEPEVTPTPDANINHSISGTINLSANMVADSDNNDPLSSLTDNSRFETAQVVDNRTRIHGFATLAGTNFPGDAFENTADEFDVYGVTLQSGQVLQMQVVDYVNDTDQSRYSGDLDLHLFDSTFELIASSQSVTEFESIIVPEDGEYYLAVEAFSGASKYALTIGIELQTANLGFDQNMQLNTLIPGEAIVKEKPSSTGIQKSSTDTRAKLISLTSASAANTIQKNNHQNTAPLLSSLKDQNPESFDKHETLRQIKTLRISGNMEYASPNHLVQAKRIPSDEYFSLQWHYPLINLPQAWDITTGEEGNEVIVAVIDTGVFLAHPELQNQLVPGFDFIRSPQVSLDGDGIDSNPDDPGDSSVLGQSSWHGTHVSGTIAAQTNSNLGVAGASWGAKIMPLRALGNGGGSSYDIMQSMLFAAGFSNDSGTLPQQRADIINLSLGSNSGSQAEADIYRQVVDSGVIVVAAAGNENTSQLSYPASYSGVVSVSAVTINQTRASYSNFGSEIDIAAPGGDAFGDANGDGYLDQILSTMVDDSSGSRRATFDFSVGTSMASPHVAGVFALMKAVYPELSPSDIDALLSNGELTNDLGDPGRDNTFGHGLIDALKCVQAAEALANGGSPPETGPLMVSSLNSLNLSSNLTGNITLSNRGDGTPNLTSITQSGNQNWISVSSSGADTTTGIGSWEISVDQSGLIDGTHVGTVNFNFASAVLPISVTTTVGDTASTEGETSQLFLLVIDWNTDEVLGTALVNNDPPYSWSIDGIPGGEYYIAVGSDIDNDGLICQFGESCGAYPSLNQIEKIVVNSEVPNVNFTADIVSNSIGTQASSKASSQSVNKSKKTAFELAR